ncbi:MAG: NAD(P)-dependent alcohol dehydrogenase [Pseudobdellovibrio sp.]
MKSLSIEKYGSLDFLKVIDRPTVEPGDSEVRIDVVCSSLNPADYKVVLGEVKILHGRQFPLALGYDFSGVVSAVGNQVNGYKVGDEVFGFLPYGPFNQQGSFGQSLIEKPDHIAKKPKSVDHAQAASAATSALTAIQALRDIGLLKDGGRVLVTGVSGGVGSVALQVAKRLGASEVVAIGSGKGLDLAKRMGADKTIDRKKQDVYSEAQGQFDVIFDSAAAYRWSDWNHKLNPGGCFVTTLPSSAFVIDKFKSLFSSTRVGFVSVKSKSEDLSLLAGWLESGLQIPVDVTVSLDEVKAQLVRLKHGEVLGKVCVRIN